MECFVYLQELLLLLIILYMSWKVVRYSYILYKEAEKEPVTVLITGAAGKYVLLLCQLSQS